MEHQLIEDVTTACLHVLCIIHELELPMKESIAKGLLNDTKECLMSS